MAPPTVLKQRSATTEVIPYILHMDVTHKNSNKNILSEKLPRVANNIQNDESKKKKNANLSQYVCPFR